MKRLLIVGGTYDCHEFISRFKNYSIDIVVTVATHSGKEFLSNSGVNIIIGRLNSDGFSKIIRDRNIDFVLDSSHPYAYEVTATVNSVCKNLNVPYIRYLRPSIDIEGTLTVSNSEMAAEMAVCMEGNILLTTGSKDLNVYIHKIKDYQKRLFVRIIPALESIKKCFDLNIPISNIIAISGCFSVDMNMEMMKHIKTSILITKDSGQVGGFVQKVEAAKNLELKIIVIQRQNEFVYSLSDYDSIVKLIVERLNLGRNF